jgi:hypothetical protein
VTLDSVADTQVIYLNGAADTSGTTATKAIGASASAVRQIGRLTTSGYINGILSDVRCYATTVDGSAALTAAEVAAIYAGRG